jgi:phasin family protein
MAEKAKSGRESALPPKRDAETRIRRKPAKEELRGRTMKTTKDALEGFSARGAEYAQQGYDQLLGATREQIEKASTAAFKAYEELSKFQKDNYEAYVAASTILAKGVENVSKAWVALTQETFENSAQTAKALLGAKTLREAIDLQNDWAKSNFDKLVAESTKLSEMTVKVTNEALAPINSRINVAVERMLKPVAAA